MRWELSDGYDPAGFVYNLRPVTAADWSHNNSMFLNAGSNHVSRFSTFPQHLKWSRIAAVIAEACILHPE